jgi:hypothetical protein
MSDTGREVLPLGFFGVVAGQPELEKLRGELLTLVGKLPEDECPAIATYLRAGTIVFAIMEGTSDIVGAFPKPLRENFRWGCNILGVVGGRFAVSGGSAIQTDGVYYWRTDTAEYVEHYRVALPEDFLRRGRAQGWVAPPQMTEADMHRVYEYLEKHARRLRPRSGRDDDPDQDAS